MPCNGLRLGPKRMCHANGGRGCGCLDIVQSSDHPVLRIGEPVRLSTPAGSRSGLGQRKAPTDGDDVTLIYINRNRPAECLSRTRPGLAASGDGSGVFTAIAGLDPALLMDGSEAETATSGIPAEMRPGGLGLSRMLMAGWSLWPPEGKQPQLRHRGYRTAISRGHPPLARAEVCLKLGVALILIALCSPAYAADPWRPILDLFRIRPAPPVTSSPYHPSPDIAQDAIDRALIDAELQAAIRRANEAAEKLEEAARAAEKEKAAQEPIRDSKSPVPPRPKAKKPLDIRPKVTSSECAQIGIGIGLIGKDGVKREAIARGHSAAEINEVQKACGF